jgi:mRNA interferase RelE/StbE
MRLVTYRKSAKSALRKLPAKVQARLINALATYAKTGQGDVKALTNRRGALLRVGDYRVIFAETDATIEVRSLGHRKDVYR